MASRWDEGQVLALAPDASGAMAGQRVARSDAAWTDLGSDAGSLWGRCAGSGTSDYRVAVDLSGPASRCSCPSRKFPCKHAVGLLLRWSRGQVPEAVETPADVAEWLASRRARTEKATARPASAGSGTPPAEDGTGVAPTAGTERGPGVAARVARREQRVADGLDELERWLHDQLRAGLAAARHEGVSESARVAARLVDAQASGAAGRVRDLSWGAADDRWPDRVLAEMARLALLVSASRSVGSAPPSGHPSAGGHVDGAVVRSHVGWTTPTEEVLARPGIADRWAVVWQVDDVDGRLVTRRTHLHGTTTGRDLLVLAWGAAGQAPESGLVPGTVLDADVHVHPGSPVRGVVGERRRSGAPDGDRVRGARVATATRGLAAGLAADPWLRTLPVVLEGVRPARSPGGWAALDEQGDSLPLLGAGPPMDWLAASGGRPTTVAGELSRQGLRVRAVLDGTGAGAGPAAALPAAVAGA